jgi:hypothetical protein
MKNLKLNTKTISLDKHYDFDSIVTPYEFRRVSKIIQMLGVDFEEDNFLKIYCTPQHFLELLVEASNAK